MDQVQKESLPEEMNEIKKFCSDCKTSKTPLWRAGPSGPKSLCNACGIRYRKKRSAIVAFHEGVEKKKEKSSSSTASHTNTNTAAAAASTGTTPSIAAAKSRGGGGRGRWGKLSEDLRVRLVALGKEVVILQRQRSPTRKRRRTSVVDMKLMGEEEEQAAVLLMSLSCGFVFA